MTPERKRCVRFSEVSGPNWIELADFRGWGDVFLMLCLQLQLDGVILAQITKGVIMIACFCLCTFCCFSSQLYWLSSCWHVCLIFLESQPKGKAKEKGSRLKMSNKNS